MSRWQLVLLQYQLGTIETVQLLAAVMHAISNPSSNPSAKNGYLVWPTNWSRALLKIQTGKSPGFIKTMGSPPKPETLRIRPLQLGSIVVVTGLMGLDHGAGERQSCSNRAPRSRRTATQSTPSQSQDSTSRPSKPTIKQIESTRWRLRRAST